MKKKQTTVLFFTIVLLLSQIYYAQIDSENLEFDTDANKRGSSAAAMLGIGVGARAEALGGAFVAIADDPSALYWNPAGITQIKSISLQVTKTDWFVDTDFSALDLVVPLPSLGSAVGFHLAMLDYGDNPVRTVFRPEGTGESYSASDFVAGLYLAMGITDRVSASFGVKYFQQSIWHVSGSAIGFDLGILFQTPLQGLKLGGTISNLGSEFGLSGRDLTRIMDIDGRRDIYQNNDNVPINIATETYALPLLFRFGISNYFIKNENLSLLTAYDILDSRDYTVRHNLGLEVGYRSVVFLRGGYKFNYDETNYTAGIGLDMSEFIGYDLTLDYAFLDYGVFDSLHQFTFNVNF